MRGRRGNRLCLFIEMGEEEAARRDVLDGGSKWGNMIWARSANLHVLHRYLVLGNFINS